MDVYTTSFNVYPFSVSPYPPTRSTNGASSPADYLTTTTTTHYSQNGYPTQNHHPYPASSSITTNPSPAVHRHQSTKSGLEAVWENLNRLTLLAKQQYPGTVVNFSLASPSSSEDSLTLINAGAGSLVTPTTPGGGATPNSSAGSVTGSALPPHPSSGGVPAIPTPNAGGSSTAGTGSPHPMLNMGYGVLSANVNAALVNAQSRGTTFNFTITGSSQASVMGARGLILREAPVQNRSVIRVARSEILEPVASAPDANAAATTATTGATNSSNNSNHATSNGAGGPPSSVPMPTVGGTSNSSTTNTSSGPGSRASPSPSHHFPPSSNSAPTTVHVLKKPVIQRLDEIAAQTRANISVLKTSSASNSLPYPPTSSSAFASPSSPYGAYGSGGSGLYAPTPSSAGGAGSSASTMWPSSSSNGIPAGPANGHGFSSSSNGAPGTPGAGGASPGGLLRAPSTHPHLHHPSSFGGANAAATAAGLQGEKMCELIITGPGDTVDAARLRLLVMLDELGGLHGEQVEIDYKLHAILAGRKRRMAQQIQEETATNIYFPPIPLRPFVPPNTQPPQPQQQPGADNNGSSRSSPVNGTTNSWQTQPGSSVYPSTAASIASLGYNPNAIWITGEYFNVARARDALYQLAAHKVRTKTIISRDTAILSRKLDWMLTQRLDDVKAIQRDNGTYINFPLIGSSQSVCTIYGDSRVAIERTVRAIMLLASQFYVACVWLLPLTYNVLVPSANGVNPAAMGPVLRAVCGRSGAEVVCKSGTFEMHGLESEVRAAVAMILELDIIKAFQTEIRFQLELANEHREFISGKKNGKLNKIMTNTSVKIKFESLNEHNFLIDVSGSSAHNVLRGLTLLQDELPAELAFHVPEMYHKRIIGVAGRSIQRIMKKYGVYVKFNSAVEMRAQALDDEENVLARTPAKNALSLDSLRASVMELVPAKDKDFITESIPVPRRYHRALFGEKSIFLRDIESKTNCKITFPGDGLDIVAIFGPESQVHQAGAMLLDHVPFEADLSLPAHSDLHHLSVSSEFLAFSERIQRDYQVSIVPSTDNVNRNVPFTFRFRCQRSNCDCLSPAREALDAFLATHSMNPFPRKLSGAAPPVHSPGVVGQAPASLAIPQAPHFAPGSGHVFGNGHIHRRVDSFTDAFPHFNSRLLPTPMESDGLDRRIRMASSTPDVKALFNNSPAQRYRAPEQRLPEQDEIDDASYYSRSSFGSVSAATGAALQKEYAASLSDYSTANDYTSGSSEYWNNSTPTNTYGGGLQYGLPPPRALANAHSDDAYKRGSDSFLEAKMREKLAAQAQQRNATSGARAQSLDLSSLGMASRGMTPSTGGGAGGTIDEAGADGETEEYDGSPPMMPSFPSLNDPPVNAVQGNPKHRGMIGGRPAVNTDLTTREMHTMFNSLNLDSPVQ